MVAVTRSMTSRANDATTQQTLQSAQNTFGASSQTSSGSLSNILVVVRPPTAQQQFFGTTELVETMLLHMVSDSFYQVADSFSKIPTFKSVIDGSTRLQRALFLEPVAADAALEDKTSSETGHTEVKDQNGNAYAAGQLHVPAERTFVRANPALLSLEHDTHDWSQKLRVVFDMEDILDINGCYSQDMIDRTPSLRDMYLTQPPVTEVDIWFQWSEPCDNSINPSYPALPGSEQWKMEQDEGITFWDLESFIRGSKHDLEFDPRGTETVNISLKRPSTMLDEYLQLKDGKYYLKKG